MVARTEKRNVPIFWGSYLLPTILPLLFGLGLGLLSAILIVNEAWIFVLAVIAAVPTTIAIIKYPFTAIIIWMAVMPWFPFQGPYKYIFFTVHRFLIPLALCIIVLSRMLRLEKNKSVKLGPASLAMVAFGAMGITSIIVTGNHWETIFSIQDRFLVPFAAYWLVRFSDAQQRELKRLIPLMLLLNLAEGVIGLVSWFAPQALPSIWKSGLIGDRTVGTFRQPAVYACILILFFTFFYHDAMNRKKGSIRTLQILAFGLGMVCIFFTFTRGAWLAGLLVLLGLLFLYPKSTATLVATILPIMLILSSSVLADAFAHAVERLNTTEEGANARIVLANAGKKMFNAKPVLGWGYGNYDRYDWKFLERVEETTPTTWQIRKGTSHHTYITILAEMGIIGFFFYAFPVIWWLGLTIKALPRLPKEGFWSRRLLIAMWLPIGIHIVLAQDLDMRFFTYCLTLFWINLGFIANMVQASLQSADSDIFTLADRFVHRHPVPSEF
jgi:O-antigen ligase